MKSEFLKIVIFSMMISALSLSACKKKVENQIREFIGFKEAKHENVQITLPNLQKALKAAGLPEVKINAIKQTLATETQRDTMRTHLMISFGMMSREQCEVARKVYADRWKDSLSGVHCSIAATIGRAGAMGGALTGRPSARRVVEIVGWSNTTATSFMRPPHLSPLR